jgi:hypothetical protein
VTGRKEIARRYTITHHIGVYGVWENFTASKPHFVVGTIGEWFKYHPPYTPTDLFTYRTTTNTKYGVGTSYLRFMLFWHTM